ncbi:holo-ACP synthase [Gelidibacter mesophilus]|uniref:holo-ACP synthase n=1 Tax=Gelidibacter mesophilus TaxID=169050 RepID=UPI00040FF554|nr:holo-ACP synthase [Gelidibacter mesophilus]
MIGIDIESIARFEKLYSNKKRLLEKMFNKYEWEYALTKPNPSQTLTGIWCAKEAVLKAIYPSEEIFIKDITIKHKKSGEPYVFLNFKQRESKVIHISIAHAKEYATAVALITSM